MLSNGHGRAIAPFQSALVIGGRWAMNGVNVLMDRARREINEGNFRSTGHENSVVFDGTAAHSKHLQQI